ncbi:hypothetical protein GP486_005471 [Trichoglossum hirsutum]|uniref:UBA domain-containing protein n=1 Tax=Trichoglossum hirsutum TaxID=265104 RepID=A0A9P8L9D9_9PEZI|nr:hypothetical protein GP486_005471 [Trichoglossum hirsutum]
MNDLSDLDWSRNGSKPPPTTSYPALRPTPPPPPSGRSAPLSAQASSTHGGGTPQRPSTKSGSDSFAGLVSFGSSKSASKLTLREQQRLLQEEKQREEGERRRRLDAQFGAGDSRFWDALEGNGAPTAQALDPAPSFPTFSGAGGQSSSGSVNRPSAALGLSSKETPAQNAEEDLLAAFSAASPVDSSSHFPPPLNVGSQGTVFSAHQEGKTKESQYGSLGLADDEDPFGLGSMGGQTARPKPAPSGQSGDDDILGLLGKPVSDVVTSKPRDPSPDHVPDGHVSTKKTADDPRDMAIAELVDMGFPADKARQALAETDTGLNVQAAVGWLLNEAHREARQKSQAADADGDRPERNGSGRATQSTSKGRRPRGDEEEEVSSRPAWMQQTSRSSSSQRKGASGSLADGGEKDITQIASEVGNNLLKSANSLWSSGRKKVQKAVAEFQQEGDLNQPKWMRESSAEGRAPSRGRDDENGGRNGISSEAPPPRKSQRQDADITEEALMLEARPPPTRRQRELELGPHTPGLTPPRGRSPIASDVPTEPTRRQDPQQTIRQRPQDAGPKSKLTRQAIEEESSNAYISPARRKKASVPSRPMPAEPEPDLLVGGSRSGRRPAELATVTPPPIQSRNPFIQQKTTSKSSTPTPAPAPQRPKVLPRRVPPAPAPALSTSASHRQKGTEAYKRGDYSSAHTAYSAALSPLPDLHPISIIILCNRALVNLKVGDPKAAVSDAETALDIIGPSKGEGEFISLTNEGDKEMREFFGKALMRKAEALEQMEKWPEAAKAWKEAVEAGVGGAVSIQARNRCEKATGSGAGTTAIASVRKQPPRKPPPRKPKPPSLSVSSTAPSAEAVERLRAANAAAERAEDEKFALADAVDERLGAWKNGKEANLRALLASLDTVLWAEAGWKKVGMHELVIANKVKLIYMKGIAKISTNATTEQRMISAAVFSTLNEAWDRFKKENGL